MFKLFKKKKKKGRKEKKKQEKKKTKIEIPKIPSLFKKKGFFRRKKKDTGSEDEKELAKKADPLKQERERLKKQRIERRKKEKAAERKRLLKIYLKKSGLYIEPKKIKKLLFNLCVLVNLGISAYIIYLFAQTGRSVGYLLFIIAIIWVIAFILILFALWLLFYFVLDLKVFRRKLGVEEVLPDFLQLASANIRAGMPIDQALWFAVRPRFGVLAKEIETVAKETMAGEDLRDALRDFSDKYKSTVLKRSINLLIEGLDAGGEVGELLNKIATDIQESRVIKKEMAADITTYVIFITFSAIIAAPLLMGLSYQLLNIIGQLTARMGTTATAPSTSIGLSISKIPISLKDFRIFAFSSLSVTAFFSAMMISVIKKGNVKEGMRYIPTFIIVACILFYFSMAIMGKVLGGLI